MEPRNRGTEVHGFIEKVMKLLKPFNLQKKGVEKAALAWRLMELELESEMDSQVEESFMECMKSVRKIHCVEEKVENINHERTGGPAHYIYDAVVENELGEKIVVDWKTGKKYAECNAQIIRYLDNDSSFIHGLIVYLDRGVQEVVKRPSKKVVDKEAFLDELEDIKIRSSKLAEAFPGKTYVYALRFFMDKPNDILTVKWKGLFINLGASWSDRNLRVIRRYFLSLND